MLVLKIGGKTEDLISLSGCLNNYGRWRRMDLIIVAEKNLEEIENQREIIFVHR